MSSGLKKEEEQQQLFRFVFHTRMWKFAATLQTRRQKQMRQFKFVFGRHSWRGRESHSVITDRLLGFHPWILHVGRATAFLHFLSTYISASISLFLLVIHHSSCLPSLLLSHHSFAPLCTSQAYPPSAALTGKVNNHHNRFLLLLLFFVRQEYQCYQCLNHSCRSSREADRLLIFLT